MMPTGFILGRLIGSKIIIFFSKVAAWYNYLYIIDWYFSIFFQKSCVCFQHSWFQVFFFFLFHQQSVASNTNLILKGGVKTHQMADGPSKQLKCSNSCFMAASKIQICCHSPSCPIQVRKGHFGIRQQPSGV